MPTIENQSLSKLYYSIGEVAEHLQVNASLLRFWEKEFNLAVSKKNKKGNRLYTVKEIEKIQRIYQLVKVEGYTLDGAKKALKVKVEPHLSVQNEVVAASLEANTGFVQNASSLDAGTHQQIRSHQKAFVVIEHAGIVTNRVNFTFRSRTLYQSFSTTRKIRHHFFRK
jgi:DNA-binding transcriptional MerR regulator